MSKALLAYCSHISQRGSLILEMVNRLVLGFYQSLQHDLYLMLRFPLGLRNGDKRHHGLLSLNYYMYSIHHAKDNRILPGFFYRVAY